MARVAIYLEGQVSPLLTDNLDFNKATRYIAEGKPFYISFTDGKDLVIVNGAKITHVRLMA